MKKISEIIETLKTDLETDLPVLLLAETLDNFSHYSKGGSKDPDILNLAVYHDNGYFNDESNILDLIVSAQLYRVTYEDALKYIDVIKGYLKEYEPSRLGFTILESLNDDSWELDANTTTYLFFDLKYSDQLDSCD